MRPTGREMSDHPARVGETGEDAPLCPADFTSWACRILRRQRLGGPRQDPQASTPEEAMCGEESLG